MRHFWGENGGSGLGSHDALLGDARLSVPARGLAVYLLLLPDGVRPDPLTLGAGPGETPESIEGYLRELEAAGYLTRSTTRDDRDEAVQEVRLAARPLADAPDGGRRFVWRSRG